MPKYTRSKVEGLWKVDDGSGVEQWTIDRRALFPKPEEFRAGPIRYNTESKGYKKTDPGIPGMKDATYEVDPDYTDQEGKSVSFGTREHELRAAEREANAGIRHITLPGTGESHPVDSEKGQLHLDIHTAFINNNMKSPYVLGEKDQQEQWDSSQYDPEKDGYASEYGYDPEADIAWENKRAKKAGQQTQYGWKAMLKEARPDGNAIFSRWLNAKVLGGHEGTASGDVKRVPFYWTGDEPEHGEDVQPSGYFTTEDFMAASPQTDKRTLKEGRKARTALGPEQYFKQAGAAEAQNIARLGLTNPEKPKQQYETVNKPERATVEQKEAVKQETAKKKAAAKARTKQAVAQPEATVETTGSSAAKSPAKKAPAKKAASSAPITCDTCGADSNGQGVMEFMAAHQH